MNKAHLQILHLEDEKKTSEALREELIKKQIHSYNVDNMQDALKVLDTIEVDLIVCDGSYPLVPGGEIGKNFIIFAKELKKRGLEHKMIPWTNSSHAHEYCKNNNIKSNSKFQLEPYHFERRGREFIQIKMLTPKEMAKLIFEKLVEQSGIKELEKTCSLFYKESGTILAASMAFDVRTGLFKNTAKENYGNIIAEFEDDTIIVYMDDEKDAIIAQNIYDKIIKEGFFTEIEEEVLKRSAALKNISKEFVESDLTRWSDEQIIEKHKAFTNHFMQMRMYSSLPTALEHATNLWTKHLENILEKKNTGAKKNEIFITLTTPKKNSYLKDYELEIARISSGKTEQSASDLQKAYAWIKYAFEGEELSVQEVEEAIAAKSPKEHIAFLEKYHKEKEELAAEKERLIKELKLSNEEKEHFRYGEEIIWIKFYRKGTFAQAYYSVEHLFKEIGQRINLDLKTLKNMKPEEVQAALILKEFPKDIITKRRKSSVLFCREGKTIILDPETKTYYKTNKNKETKEEITGQAAYAGKSTGKVCVINKPEEMSKMEKGDILVSRSTNPALLPAMRKAAAIVTNLGGLTCHAAIIAREMKIPCLVGTKNAAEILEDGELIEVDADTGIVRKIGNFK